MLLCRQIFTSLAQFPFDFLRFIDFPMSAVDLYVGRADVTFDEFRVRQSAASTGLTSVLVSDT